MKIQESGEMYLETILNLKKTKAEVHSVDICEALGYSKSSVSRAFNLLKDKGFIDIGTDGEITFTPQGLAHAEEIYRRHGILTAFLQKIGVDEQTAATDACRIEHVISQQTIDAIKDFLQK